MAAALVEEYGIATYAIKGEDDATYYGHLTEALELKPNVTLDDGADLVTVLHTRRARPGAVGHRRHGRNHHRRYPADRDGPG